MQILCTITYAHAYTQSNIRSQWQSVWINCLQWEFNCRWVGSSKCQFPLPTTRERRHHQGNIIYCSITSTEKLWLSDNCASILTNDYLYIRIPISTNVYWHMHASHSEVRAWLQSSKDWPMTRTFSLFHGVWGEYIQVLFIVISHVPITAPNTLPPLLVLR